MTPLQFEQQYRSTWQELQKLLEQAEEARSPVLDGDRLASLYRRSCEHLALAQARAYPVHLVDELESLTHRAHRLIYRRASGLGAAWRRQLLVGFPQAVRAHAGYVALATALFVLPLLVVGVMAWRDPGFILHLMDAQQAAQFDEMYGDGEHAIGALRESDTDWRMFGHYIWNNIGIGFQCYAGGIFFGLFSIVCLVFNGLFIGAVAGYLTARGHGDNFYPFVVTHGAFELTAIVLSGAAGLRLGHALLAPGRRSRLGSLRHAATESIVLVYGVFALLLVAAGVEAFWSSSRWVSPAVKYAVGGVCWVAVLAYLGWQGRPARPTHPTARVEGSHAR